MRGILWVDGCQLRHGHGFDQHYVACFCKVVSARRRSSGIKTPVAGASAREAGIANWNRVIDLVFEELLCDPALLEVLCVECHDKEHAK